MKSDNTPDTSGKDNGVTVGDGKAKPQIDKSANKSSARVGDKIAYTLTVRTMIPQLFRLRTAYYRCSSGWTDL